MIEVFRDRCTSTASLLMLLAVAVLFVVGCEKDADTILIADGRRLTTVGRDREIDLRTKVFGIMRPTASVADAERFRKTLMDSAEEHFIVESGLLRVARARGISAPRDEVMGRLAPLSSALRCLAPGDQALAEEIAEREVLCSRVVESLSAEIDVSVSEDELDTAMERLHDYADMVASTNALVYARATNVWNEICRGADFTNMAARWSEADDPSSCEWGTFPLAALVDSPELQRLLPEMSPGDITPPVEGDNGLVVVRLVEVDRSSDPATYCLDRIFFRLPECAPTLSRDELAVEMAKERRKRQLATILRSVREKTVVDRLGKHRRRVDFPERQ